MNETLQCTILNPYPGDSQDLVVNRDLLTSAEFDIKALMNWYIKYHQYSGSIQVFIYHKFDKETLLLNISVSNNIDTGKLTYHGYVKAMQPESWDTYLALGEKVNHIPWMVMDAIYSFGFYFVDSTTFLKEICSEPVVSFI